jgi:hypothetical protein
LGLIGVYSGPKVVANSLDALLHLHRSRSQVRAQLDALDLQRGNLTGLDALTTSRQALDAQATALRGYDAALLASRNEQLFNLAVPGVLQTVAAVAAVAAAAHLVVGGVTAGAVSSGLFAAYGFALAGKHALGWHATRHAAHAVPKGPHAFAQAFGAYLQGRQRSLGESATAWGAVAVCGLGGMLVTSGAAVPAAAAPAVLAATLIAAGWAVWQNSRTRYVPHLPLGEHTHWQHVATELQRQRTFESLSAQDAAIKAAVAQLRAALPQVRVPAYIYEQLALPQCGPRANQVLAQLVQGLPKAQRIDAQAQHVACLRAQVQAAQIFCTHERRLLAGRDAAAYSSLVAERGALGAACEASKRSCSTATPRDGDVRMAQASFGLHTAALHLERSTQRLAALERLQVSLDALGAHDDAALVQACRPEADAPWTQARILLLQHSGTLGDAVDAQFVAQHPNLFSRLPVPDAWPINNLYLLPQHHAAFARAIAPQLDGAFVHAFFNPRRIEAEIDYLMDRQMAADMAAQIAPAAACGTVAPAANGATCCR